MNGTKITRSSAHFLIKEWRRESSAEHYDQIQITVPARNFGDMKIEFDITVGDGIQCSTIILDTHRATLLAKAITELLEWRNQESE